MRASVHVLGTIQPNGPRTAGPCRVKTVKKSSWKIGNVLGVLSCRPVGGQVVGAPDEALGTLLLCGTSSTLQRTGAAKVTR